MLGCAVFWALGAGSSAFLARLAIPGVCSGAAMARGGLYARDKYPVWFRFLITSCGLGAAIGVIFISVLAHNAWMRCSAWGHHPYMPGIWIFGAVQFRHD